MKWFKHFTDASNSTRLNVLIDGFGVEGYGRYWLLMELLAEEFDGSDEAIEVHFRKISAKVQIKFAKKLETFMQKLCDFHLIEWEVEGKIYKIKSLILAELQDKDSKYNRKRIAKPSPNATLDIEVDRDIDIDNTVKRKKSSPVASFDFESAYQKYPKKAGKSKGIAKVQKEITTQKQFEDFTRAIENYSALCKSEGREPKYIKQFSTFAGEWEDFVDVEVPLDRDEKIKKLFTRQQR